MRRFFLLLSAAMAFLMISPQVHAQGAEPYIGQVLIVSFGFAPRGWAMCNGQLLPINQYQALFSLLGTTFGGDGRTNFALPDLRGRVPIHAGQGVDLNGNALQNYTLGETGGVESVTLTIAQMPAHTHIVEGQSSFGTSANPTNSAWAAQSRLDIYSSTTPDTPMAAAAIPNAGGGQPHDNHSPYLTVNYIIAMQGVFPSRD